MEMDHMCVANHIAGRIQYRNKNKNLGPSESNQDGVIHSLRHGSNSNSNPVPSPIMKRNKTAQKGYRTKSLNNPVRMSHIRIRSVRNLKFRNDFLPLDIAMVIQKGRHLLSLLSPDVFILLFFYCSMQMDCESMWDRYGNLMTLPLKRSWRM